MKHWLVILEEDIEPTIMGPYKGDRGLLQAARRHRKSDAERRDGLFGLEISSSGSPEIYAFSGLEIEPGDEN